MTNETQTIEYEPIFRRKSAGMSGLFSASDFSPEQSDKIITNIVNRIKEYERFNDVEVKYQKNFNDKGIERIIEVEIKNNLIDGEIIYHPISNWGFLLSLGPSSASISAKIYFSKKFNDRKEYFDLINLVEDCGLNKKS